MSPCIYNISGFKAVELAQLVVVGDGISWRPGSYPFRTVQAAENWDIAFQRTLRERGLKLIGFYIRKLD